MSEGALAVRFCFLQARLLLFGSLQIFFRRLNKDPKFFDLGVEVSFPLAQGCLAFIQPGQGSFSFMQACGQLETAGIEAGKLLLSFLTPQTGILTSTLDNRQARVPVRCLRLGFGQVHLCKPFGQRPRLVLDLHRT